jgi:hypothetical protein
VLGKNSILLALNLPDLIGMVAAAIFGLLAMTSIMSPIAAGYATFSVVLGIFFSKFVIMYASCCGTIKEVTNMDAVNKARYRSNIENLTRK